MHSNVKNDEFQVQVVGRFHRALDEVAFIVVYKSDAAQAINASATLQDNGNFVLRETYPDGSTKRVLWKSFDYPNNILLPGMRLGINWGTGHKWSLTSWVGLNTPAQGSFTLRMDPDDKNQLVIWWCGIVYWTSGPPKNGTLTI
ncbi:hypothetical protein L6164_004401 [Bauhinia variegata]|uniref:Uncharacterized protein n=1 Tax=Bauhinia variegata TaxID=167791 RepID=A0ACB9Q714_BAUVA|nr:hypothetical protein L6164_004401 [Bauhinia variegata]